MAKLTVVEEKPVPPPKKYVIELDEKEMVTLAIVLCRVGGCPETTARKHVDSLSNTLRSQCHKQGVNLYTIDKKIVQQPCALGVYFEKDLDL